MPDPDTFASTSSAAGAGSAPDSLPELAMQPIPSTAILAGRSFVAIEHEGNRYFLRATRSGKLILTK